MTTRHPVAELFSLRLNGSGQGRFTVRCPHCSTLHGHRWDGHHVAFDVSAPCSGGRDVRMYRVDLSDALEPDNSAIDDPVPNWTE